MYCLILKNIRLYIIIVMYELILGGEKMISRKNHKKVLAKKSRGKLTTKTSVLASLSIITMSGAVPAFASTWIANTPESIQIKENDTSYTMVYGDTLWAISMKINVNVQTLASINNIDLSAGEEYHLAVGTVIKWDKKGKLVAETSDGQQITDIIKTNDSNKIISDKPIGEDVTNDVKDNNISDNQINGNPNNTGNINSNDSENTDEEATKPTTPTDKWNNLTFEERENGTILRIGPFSSYEDAEEYFNSKGYKTGNIFENALDNNKWYMDVKIKDSKPVDPDPTPTEPTDPDPTPTEPTEPETNTGTVTIRYINKYGEEIKAPTIMSGKIGEMFNAMPDIDIADYTIDVSSLPEGAYMLTDGRVVARNAYTEEPQTYTFEYYIVGE
ncbi:LysM peptidoglycan-binding domain-containing protein [Enterococcus faecalis]|nr:LysM peptidoglycan-binding domain-containing protein [Enterococcus faecalis]EIB6115837.1 LysM peptidoglycan-binding domain-containing protein [Enterococcus faecalis]